MLSWSLHATFSIKLCVTLCYSLNPSFVCLCMWMRNKGVCSSGCSLLRLHKNTAGCKHERSFVHTNIRMCKHITKRSLTCKKDSFLLCVTLPLAQDTDPLKVDHMEHLNLDCWMKWNKIIIFYWCFTWCLLINGCILVNWKENDPVFNLFPFKHKNLKSMLQKTWYQREG